MNIATETKSHLHQAEMGRDPQIVRHKPLWMHMPNDCYYKLRIEQRIMK